MPLFSFISAWLPTGRTKNNRRPGSYPIGRSTRRSLRLAVEQLECRELLSGLTATIVGLPASGQSPVGTAIHVSASLKGTTAGDTYTYSWQAVDNGSTYATGTASTFSFTPDNFGTYTVDLAVTGKLGDSATANGTLTVNAVPPTAHLATSFQGTALVGLQFTASATDPSTVDTAAGFTYTWNFGDNTTGTGATPTHVYANPGTYTATLTVTDENGQQGTAKTTVTVKAPPKPTVAITGVPASDRSPVATAITLGSSVTGTTANDTYTLTWSVLKNGAAFATGSGSSVTFTPDDSGTYTAYLTVTDQFGTTVKVGKSISVYDIAPTVQLPSSFNGAALSPLAFSASATDPSPADTAAGFRFVWYFGDGATGSGATPTHTYAKPGTYTARVYAYDKHNLYGTATATVTVINAITGTFSGPASVTAGTTNAVVSFANVAGGSGGPYTYSFDFGNTGTFEVTGSSSSSTTVPETYVDSGPAALVVRGQVTDSAGDYRDFTTTIQVTHVAPTPHITLPPSVEAQVPATYSDPATDPSKADTKAGFTYYWSFGDGTPTVKGESISHTYTKPGTYKVTVTVADTAGASATATTNVTVAPAPTATFSGPSSVSAGTTNAQVSFTNPTGGTGGYTYSYDFGDTGTFEITGSSSPTATIPESYVDSGPSTLVVHGRITDNSGGYSDYTTSITVTDVAPTPSITTPSDIDAGFAAAFEGSATDPSTADTKAGFTYSWNFGDGTAAVAGADPSHTFAKAGTYTVTLKATDTHGESNTTTASVTVAPAPTATFSGPSSVNAGTTNAQVSFSNPTGGTGGYTYSYDFGDTGTFEISGSSNATATIPESYVDSGPSTLVVHGRITDSSGGYTDYTTSIKVNDVAPTPSISGPSSGEVGLADSFTASATDPSTADTKAGFTYSWNFGDGTSAVSGAAPTHTFTAAGKYTITLSATDEHGVVGTTTDTFTVASAPSATFSGPSSVNAGTTGAQVTFSNPTGGSGGYTYSYDFGDTGTFEINGSSSPTATIPESYVDSGPATLVVRGQITDSAGGYTDYTTKITINDVAPTPTITPPANIDPGVAVTFEGSATDPSTADTKAGFTYSWNFGDGTSAVSGADPSHTFAKAGSYTVTLKATDEHGESGTTSANVTVGSAPTATFSGPSSVNAGTTTAQVTFTNPTGGSGGYTYSYDFGDTGTFEITGSSSATATIPESYVDSGPSTLVVRGRITDSDGDYTDYTTSISVKDVAPTPTITPPSSLIAGDAATFGASATDPSTADTKAGFTYSWNFGDGGTATGASPSHTYASAGAYTVTLTATDQHGASASTSTSVTVLNPSTPNEPLLYQSDLQYLGAFRVPAVLDTQGSGDYTYTYGGSALAYDPANNGLFLVGMPYDQAISEISIPSVVNSSNISSLATASVLQQPVQVLNELPNNPPIPGNSGGMLIGGLMVDNGQLIGTAYANYDSDGKAVYSHFVLNSLNLSTATAGGLYQVGTMGAGLVAGYMTPIPTEWQGALGAPDLTGQADISILSRTSSGPSAFGFDPSELSASSTTPDIPYAYYPVEHQLGPYEGNADPLQSGTSTVTGAVFVPGSSSVLFFGTTGTNYDGYGLPADYGDTTNTGKGPHSLNGEYALQVWAYNAADYVAAKEGTLQPWQVQPYDVWNFTVPNNSYSIGGAAYDPTSGRLYVSLMNADNVQQYTNLPLIEVFQVTVPTTPLGPTAPQIGTLAATSQAPAPSGSTSPYAPGPVPAGTSVLLTAGNVFAINSGASITQVAFYIAPGSNAAFSPTDTLVGYGTGADNLPNGASSNWTYMMSTQGLASGSYTVFAEATDSNGLVSDPIAYTFTIS